MYADKVAVFLMMDRPGGDTSSDHLVREGTAGHLEGVCRKNLRQERYGMSSVIM